MASYHREAELDRLREAAARFGGEISARPRSARDHRVDPRYGFACVRKLAHLSGLNCDGLPAIVFDGGRAPPTWRSFVCSRAC